MKIKNINLSFFILAGLIALSFAFYVRAENTSDGTKSIFLDSDGDELSDSEEKVYGTNPTNSDTDGDGYSDGAEVRSGYDPLKKAPGDKLPGFTGTTTTISDTNNSPDGSAVLGDTSEKNLTTDIAQKITALTEKSTTDNSPVSLDDVQTLVDQSLSSNTISEDDLPAINKADINIKEQNYENLSAEKAAAKRKEDFLNYITAITYIFSSNQSKPITSLSDAPGMITGIITEITTAITSQSASGLADLVTSQQKILEQLKTVEVPEDLVDIHIKALRFALYSQQLVGLLQVKADDPMGSIANLSKIQGFITVFSDFTTQVESKLSEYGLTYDETVQEKLESYGIDAPENLNELESLLKVDTTNSTSAVTTTTNP